MDSPDNSQMPDILAIVSSKDSYCLPILVSGVASQETEQALNDNPSLPPKTLPSDILKVDGSKSRQGVKEVYNSASIELPDSAESKWIRTEDKYSIEKTIEYTDPQPVGQDSSQIPPRDDDSEEGLGVIEVRVHEVRNLPGPAEDVQLRASLGKAREELRPVSVGGQMIPAAQLRVASPPPAELLLELFQEGRSRNEMSGKVSIDTGALVESREMESIWAPLENSDSGEILVSALFSPSTNFEAREGRAGQETQQELRPGPGGLRVDQQAGPAPHHSPPHFPHAHTQINHQLSPRCYQQTRKPAHR